MTRGMQKIQAQAKNAAKQAKAGKSTSQLGAAQAAAMRYQCPVCLLPLTSVVAAKEHFDIKHPKDPRSDPTTWKQVSKT
ncbi:hypothetical protein KFE25_004417 [Diacronema lutheri]|uniref:Small EDRK-rich factor-like N-terminal domain-containing protein n=2 Tax=Diacronema lutheri TaxID=2081491 RepID=A0A8J6C2X3_DIALT|nr:hypothetical protein KFE25_004417 [Diacronema lutheri]